MNKAKRKNPILEGYKYLEFFESSSGLTYRDVAEEFNISRARVSQMIALVKKLPQEIINYFTGENVQLDFSCITERRLRPLTLMESDKAKLEKFREILKL